MIRILLIAAGVLLLLLSIQTFRAERLKDKMEIAERDRDQAITFATNEKKLVESYRNRLGNVVVQVEELNLSLANAVKLRETERLKFLDNFNKLKKDLRNLENAGSFDWLVVEDSIPVTSEVLTCPDSLRVWTYRLKDEWNDIEAKVIDTPRLEIKVPVYYADYWDRKWFLGRKHYYRETTSPNKLVSIQAQESIRFSRKKKVKH